MGTVPSRICPPTSVFCGLWEVVTDESIRNRESWCPLVENRDEWGSLFPGDL
jgi:hypothetical protein